MSYFLSNSRRLRLTLLTYWLLVPIVFAIYLFLTAAKQKIAALQLIETVPSVTITFLLVCTLLLQAATLYQLKLVKDANRKSVLGYFALFSVIQQLFTLNIPGACLSGLLYLSLPPAQQKGAIAQKNSFSPLFYLYVLFMSFLTLILVFIQYRLRR